MIVRTMNMLASQMCLTAASTAFAQSAVFVGVMAGPYTKHPDFDRFAQWCTATKMMQLAPLYFWADVFANLAE